MGVCFAEAGCVGQAPCFLWLVLEAVAQLG